MDIFYLNNDCTLVAANLKNQPMSNSTCKKYASGLPNTKNPTAAGQAMIAIVICTMSDFQKPMLLMGQVNYLL